VRDYAFVNDRSSGEKEATMIAAKATPSGGQDPVEVDSKHYQVEFEDERVRVLRVKYGPHEKSRPHRHPSAIVVILSDIDFRFYSMGKEQNIIGSKGQIICFEEPVEHAPENLSDHPFEAVMIEIKG
jgi:quercetin dioxygenase-like cupin family protein